MAATKDEIQKRLKAIIVDQLGIDESEITPESCFVDDLGCDSLDIVEIIMACEEEFEVDIPDEEAERLRTVQDAVDWLAANGG